MCVRVCVCLSSDVYVCLVPCVPGHLCVCVQCRVLLDTRVCPVPCVCPVPSALLDTRADRRGTRRSSAAGRLPLTLIWLGVKSQVSNSCHFCLKGGSKLEVSAVPGCWSVRRRIAGLRRGWRGGGGRRAVGRCGDDPSSWALRPRPPASCRRAECGQERGTCSSSKVPASSTRVLSAEPPSSAHSLHSSWF